ncbi:P-loop NTPase [Candidatus Avelusimicrobium aviculae]|uniref:P-loop NTPase n=1 Tax=Candidatus Avelusimicrobium aviculae TaxID=3416206 RepID=UPI003D0BF46E
MSESCNHDCASCSQNCADRKPESFRVAPHPMSRIQRVIGVMSGKGGVGKSFVTALLASEMKRRGHTVGVLDADITGPSIPKLFGVKGPAEGDQNGIYPVTSDSGIDIMSLNLLLDKETDPVIWRGALITGTVTQFWKDVIWADEEYLFIDMPPGTGDVTLTVFQSLPLSGIVVVGTPQDLVKMIVSKAVKMAQMMNVPVLGFVENMSYLKCPDCGKQIDLFGPSRSREVAQAFGIDTALRLPLDPVRAAACDEGRVECIREDALEPLIKKLEALPQKAG